MAFYIQGLRENEEFMGNTGFDNDLIGQSGGEYAAELNDVAKTIEDINDDYADQSSQEELDGQDIAENPVEECAIALAEAEYNWNQIFRDIASKELNEAAMGKESMLTENAVTDFFAKIKKFFVDLFKKITAFFKNWLDNALVAFRTNEGFIKKYGMKKLEDGQKAFDTSNKDFKGYDFESTKGAREKAKEFISRIKNNYDTDCIKAFDPSVNKDRNKLKTYGDRDTAALKSGLCGDANAKIDDDNFTESLKIAYFGSKEKSVLPSKKRSAKWVYDTLNGSKKRVEDARKDFNGVKKYFNEAIKICNKIEAIVKKNDANLKTEKQNEVMKDATQAVSILKEHRKLCSSAFSMYLKATKAEIAQARKIGNAYIMSLNNSTRKDTIDRVNGKKTSTNESTFFGSIQMI